MNFSSLLFRTCGALALSALTLAAHAQSAEPDEVAHAAQLQQRAAAREKERAEIAQVRREVEARKVAAEKECWQRFAVERCLSKARTMARNEGNVLRDRELRVNSEERQEKASERLREIEKKQREKTVPVVTVTPREGTGKLNTGARQAEAQQRAAEQARRVQAHEATAADKQAAQAQERAQAVQAHQEKLEAAAQHRASKADDIAKRKGAPLPVPDMLPPPPKP